MKSKITEVKSASLGGRRTRGAAIILVMFFVLIMMLAGLGILHLSYNARLMSSRLSQDLVCKICADAGLEKAIGTLNQQLADGTFSDSALPISIGETLPASEGVFSYKIVKAADSNYVAYSVGARGNFRRTVVAQLAKQTKPYFDYGILTYGKSGIAGTSTVSGYNPKDPTAPMGTYPVTIGTLGTGSGSLLTINGTLYGDAFCGVAGDPATNIIGTIPTNITGAKYALTSEPETVIPVTPAGLTTYGAYTVSGAAVTFTPANSGLYNNFGISTAKGKPGILIIDGGTVTIGINNLLQLGNNCEIQVKEGSTLLMYINGGISSMNGASISYLSATLDPTHIQLYGTGTADQIWAIKSKDVFQGLVYAPHATVSIQSSGKIVGAVVANTFASATGSQYLYDISLRTATNIALNGNVGYTIKRWCELGRGEIPDWAR